MRLLMICGMAWCLPLLAFSQEKADATYFRGGDITMLDYVEDLGARFYNSHGEQQDCMDILKANGVNLVRLRLYHTPGNAVTWEEGGLRLSYNLPAHYQGTNDILLLARRAKAHGFKIQLTLHYSDFWTNGSEQFKPKAWEGISSVAVLEDSVYRYTRHVLEQMAAQGTLPDYVSLGNEIQSGILFGHYSADGNYLDSSNGGYCNNLPQLAVLLNSGARAVREICPDAKIVLHLTLNTSIGEDTYQWFFDGMEANNVDYDIIGESYYPYWTEQPPSYIAILARSLYARYGKESLIMECGYSWTQYRPSGRYGGNYEGQLHLNGDICNEASAEGQKQFVRAVADICKNTDNHILGYLYWDPIMVEQQVNGSWILTGWVEGGQNLVGNTTWFDYTGKALPVLEAVAENATTSQTTGVAHGQRTGNIDHAASYNLQGQRVDSSYHGMVVGKKGKHIRR